MRALIRKLQFRAGRGSFAFCLLLALASLCGRQPAAFGQAASLRGLWVGQATLNYVNEVTVPLDTNNVPIAPDPNLPTPTADQAHLRLILHVNGAGQVHLLKDVAILNRKGNTGLPGAGPMNLVTNLGVLGASSGFLTAESDVVLISDERLYGQFPPQPAVRIASAVFDFGDSRATDALNVVLSNAAHAAGMSLFTNPATPNALNTLATRQSAEQAAFRAATNAAGPVVPNADVTAAFDQFLRSTNLNAAAVNAIAGAANPAAAAQGALTAATNLQGRSFYADARAVEMVRKVGEAVTVARGANSNPTNAAHNAAAAFADVGDTYHRFIAGKLFGDMIAGAAEAAARAATNAGATEATIRAAVNSHSSVVAASSEALRLKVPTYQDTRASDAVARVRDAIVSSANNFLSDSNRIQSAIQSAADQAGRNALATNVARYAVSPQAPTLDYDAFVRSDPFRTSAQVAAAAAAQGAVSEKRNNPLFTEDSLKDAALVAASEALRGTYAAAARALRTELPLVGRFGPGEGDSRLTWAVRQTNGAPVQAPGALTGTIYLPASHPTNPFRHRRHPDHAVGFDLRRHLRLDFDGATTNSVERAAFNVDRIRGTYREEVFGLHKPLGPRPQTEPIGLKVEGRFELHRISLIDTLNAL